MEPTTVTHPTKADLEERISAVRDAPGDVGTIDLIVRRPDVDGREIVGECELVVGAGVVGDNYVERGNPRTDDGAAHPEAQITLMTTHAVDAVAAGARERWPLAGDQFFVDFDLSRSNLPTGTRLSLGSAVLEVSAKPHTGCAKFRERYGVDAARWVNSDDELRLRGINAMVVEPGTVRTGDEIRRLT